MKMRCKDGDLALVIHDEETCRENIGKLVRVRGPLGYNRRIKQYCWLIEPVKADPWRCINNQVQPYLRVVSFASQVEHPDNWLLPINSEICDADEISTDKTLETI